MGPTLAKTHSHAYSLAQTYTGGWKGEARTQRRPREGIRTRLWRCCPEEEPASLRAPGSRASPVLTRLPETPAPTAAPGECRPIPDGCAEWYPCRWAESPGSCPGDGAPCGTPAAPAAAPPATPPLLPPGGLPLSFFSSVQSKTLSSRYPSLTYKSLNSRRR